MGGLTSWGLFLDMLGALILIGPEFQLIGTFLRRLNPFYHLLQWGISNDEGTEKRANSISFIFARWFINKNIDSKTIGRDESILFTSGGMHFDASRWNYEIRDGNLTISGPQPPEFEQGERRVIDFWTVWSIFYNLEDKWMYRIGLILLLTGFTMQFVAQI